MTISKNTPAALQDETLDNLGGGVRGYVKIGDIDFAATQTSSFDLVGENEPHPRDRMILNWGGENSI